MSVDSPLPPPPSAQSEESLPALKREALRPNERSRGLGTVAVVCTMAGVASGLALATTLMAMQVADSMSVRQCPYRVVAADVQTVSVPQQQDHGFLGIRYVYRDGVTTVQDVLADTPASLLGLQPGDHVISIDGAPLRTDRELQERIFNSHPGAQPSLVVERAGDYRTVRPTLTAWPTLSY